MRIGMDFRPAMRPSTGIGRYVAGLTGALSCELRLYGVFLSGNRPGARQVPNGAHLVAWRIPSRLMNLAGGLGLLPAERAIGGCDLFHHTNFVMAKVSAKTPQVMMVHDVAWLRDPACHSRRSRRRLSAVVARAARVCGAFLVPSEATAQDCREFFGIENLFVTPLGVDESFFDLAPRKADPYLLAVGTIEPRKNYPRLVRAYRAAGLDAELRIAGAAGWLSTVEEGHGVSLLGHVSEVELRRQLAGAAAVVYPSLLEGFGLPVLEAMAAGKPVLTSDREPLRSIAGDAALLVDPEDVDAIADGLRRILTDTELRAFLAAKGPARAREFTWARCADATTRAYEAVLA